MRMVCAQGIIHSPTARSYRGGADQLELADDHAKCHDRAGEDQRQRRCRGRRVRKVRRRRLPTWQIPPTPRQKPQGARRSNRISPLAVRTRYHHSSTKSPMEASVTPMTGVIKYSVANGLSMPSCFFCSRICADAPASQRNGRCYVLFPPPSPPSLAPGIPG